MEQPAERVLPPAAGLERLSAEDRLVVECAAAAAIGRAARLVEPRADLDWNQVLLVARQNRVLVPLARCLAGRDGVPPRVRAALVFEVHGIRRKARGIQGRFERALPAIVNRNQITLLRGIAHLYELDACDPWRPIGEDVDLLIDRALYPSVSGRFVDHHHVPAEVRALDPPPLEYHLDLNFKTSWCVRLGRISMDELWQRRRTRTVTGVEVGLLAPEDEIVYLAFHNVLKGFVKLYRFTDLLRVVRRGEVDWEAVVERAKRWRVDRAVWANLEILETLAPGTTDPRVRRELAPARPLAAAILQLGNLETILHDPRVTPGPRLQRAAAAARKAALFRLLTVRPGTAFRIAVGPLNGWIFRSYSAAFRLPVVSTSLKGLRDRAVGDRGRGPGASRQDPPDQRAVGGG